MNKKILLYYKYIHIANPQEIRDWQHELCTTLNLEGRIILAHEGINGTVAGLESDTQAYIAAMNEHPLFGNIDFKQTIVPAQHSYFDRLRVVVKSEIVNLGISPEQLKAENSATHLTPTQAHELLENRPEDLVILDGRNYFEARVGKFQGAITPEINTFRDFPEYIEKNLEQFKDKQVLMYCTGGIRCERASALLKEKGVAKNVFQIEGGIHRYVEQFPEGFFRGKNYVFDARITDKINDDIIGSCDLCCAPCDDYTNCCNALCNKHFIGCKDCIQTHGNACSSQCHQLVQEKKVHQRPHRTRIQI